MGCQLTPLCPSAAPKEIIFKRQEMVVRKKKLKTILGEDKVSSNPKVVVGVGGPGFKIIERK